jgi:hypothetical protein
MGSNSWGVDFQLSRWSKGFKPFLKLKTHTVAVMHANEASASDVDPKSSISSLSRVLENHPVPLRRRIRVTRYAISPRRRI